MNSTTPAMSYPSAGFTVGGVLSRTFEVLGKRFGLLFGIALAPLIIVAVSGFLFILLLASSISVGFSPPSGMHWMVVLLGFIWFTASLMILGAFCYAVFNILAGTPVTFSTALSAGLKRLVPLFLTSIVTGILIYLGFALLFIPGVILFCFFNVVIPVCMVEKQGVLGSMKRSIELTKGHRWQIFSLILLSLLGYLGAVFVMMIVSAIVLMLPTIIGGIINLILLSGFSIILSMYMYAMTSVTYHDLRAAKEGITASSLVNVFG